MNGAGVRGVYHMVLSTRKGLMTHHTDLFVLGEAKRSSSVQRLSLDVNYSMTGICLKPIDWLLEFRFRSNPIMRQERLTSKADTHLIHMCIYQGTQIIDTQSPSMPLILSRIVKCREAPIVGSKG